MTNSNPRQYSARLAPDEVPAGESRIVWIKPLAEMPRYVREVVAVRSRRCGPIRSYNGWPVLGYSELEPEAKSISPGLFNRRVFYVNGPDHDPYPISGAPVEAVDPYTVEPNVPGRMTDRGWYAAGHS